MANFTVMATLNNLIAQGNSSPEFTNIPLVNVGINLPWAYNQGAFDIDGDSSSYNAINTYAGAQFTSDNNAPCMGGLPLDIAAASINFPTYNATTNPFSCSVTGQFVLNPQTGVIFATPNLLGQSLVTIEVSEWRSGNLISRLNRDIQLSVLNTPPPPVLNLLVSSNPTLGTIAATAINGVSPFQFSLNNGSAQGANVFGGLASGNYTVVVTDAIGSSNMAIFLNAPTSNAYTSNNTIFNIFPNPNQGLFQIEIENKEMLEVVNMKVIDVFGKTVVANEFPSNLHKIKENINLAQLPKGIYILYITDNDNIRCKKLIVIQ
jgi:Secretion system C-terminal sorting domain